MKLVVITNILAPYRIPLFNALHVKVGDLTVLLMANKHEDREWKLDTCLFNVQILPGFHFRPPGHSIALHWNYSTITALKKLNPDAVISGGYAPANISAFFFCKIFRKKHYSWGELTLEDGACGSIYKRYVRRLIIKGSTGAIASSSLSAKAFEHYGAHPSKILISIMPVDNQKFHSLVTAARISKEAAEIKSRFGTGPVLLSLGRMVEAKGYSELFSIYEQLLRSFPTAVLVLVGNGPCKEEYLHFVCNKRWTNVFFTGYLHPESAAVYWAISDVFVFHTLRDSFGAVISEAMATGTPIAASIHAYATADLIEDGITGYRIDPKNTLGTTNTIIKILNMPVSERRELASRAYERISQFSAEHSASEIVDFIHQGKIHSPPRWGRSVSPEAKP